MNRANQAMVPKAPISVSVSRHRLSASFTSRAPVSQTGNDLDVAIIGKGWFRVQGPDNATLYTRAGAFNMDSTGRLVTTDGYPVLPAITIPTDATETKISADGIVSVRIGTATQMTEVGQLSMSNFANEAGLRPLGDNLFAQTDASGAAVDATPQSVGFGYVKQNYLEGSNVDSVKEITDMISAQRAYEMNSKVITTADQMAQIVSQNLK